MLHRGPSDDGIVLCVLCYVGVFGSKASGEPSLSLGCTVLHAARKVADLSDM